MRRHLLAVLALAACGHSAHPAAPAAPTVDAARLEAALTPYVQAFGAHWGEGHAMSGFVLVAQHDRPVYARAFGYADRDQRVAADADTSFRIGSVTKQFTAAMVMKLIEKGTLHFDDAMPKLGLDFPTGDKTVTLRQLLTHTSGIPSYTDIGPEWEKKQPLELTHEELLALVAGKPFDFEPGSKWRYNNTGYYLLGVMLEKQHGKSYAEVLQDEVCAPLGLSRTRYDSNTELIKNRARGYSGKDGKLVNADFLGMSQPGAAGALLSTGGDLVRWSMALSSGKVVKPESYKAMTTPTVLPDGHDTHYGFGLMAGEMAGQPCIWHNGGINGFNSVLIHVPSAGLHLAVISNSERLNADKIGKELLFALLGVPMPVAKDQPTTPELRQRLAGNYRIEDFKLELKVFDKDGKVMVQGQGQNPAPLLWQGGDEFLASFDNSVKFVFAKDAKSFELHQGGGIFVAKRQE
jgi:CubicO group peptidase (beta-lactamase class C family)